MSTKKKEESFKVKGEHLLAQVKKLIKEGNVLINIPLTIGIVGAVLAPVLAAVGAIAALVTECTVSVERK